MIEKIKQYLLKIFTFLSSLFKAKKRDDTGNNWFEERYDKIMVQRNILILLLFISIILTIIGVVAVSYVSTAKKLDAFVIQVQKNTGNTTIVNPINSEILNGNDAISQFFIKKYVTARETYNAVDFLSHARDTVKFMSTNIIYYQYLGYINIPRNDPQILYGNKNTTFLTSKSWSKLSKNKYIYRFSVQETSNQKKIYNKIAVIEFEYRFGEFKEKQMDINPVGFTVTGYRVNQDDS